uniref:Carbonic anhydrase n=1 Tax=Globodera rostochiensis TaxID=31243 RepID=A0A914H0Z6_GLORO
MAATIASHAPQLQQQNVPTSEEEMFGKKNGLTVRNDAAAAAAAAALKQQNGQAKVGQATSRPLNVQDWDYDEHGECGPKHWLHIANCEHLGNHQSPIDFRLSKMRVLPLNSHPLCLVNYKRPLAGQLVNTGCGIQFRPDPQVEPPEIYGGMLEQNYRFVQYHFHWSQNDNEGSEHTIGGLRYPAELHLVHQGVKDPSKLAVLGIFLKLDDGVENGEPKKFVFSSDEMEALKKVVEFEQSTAIDSKHSLTSKLPPNCCQDVASCAEHFVSSFVRYEGSLTTPPCSENVTWTVFTDPLLVTKEQMSLLRALKDCKGKVIEKNYRQVQKCAAGREVFFMVAPTDDLMTKM